MNGSLAAACGWTLLRTISLMLVGWPIMVWVERWLRSVAPSRRWLAFSLTLSPFLLPELLVGYAYRYTSMIWPRWAEPLCAVLLLFRVLPVGVIALLATPPSPVSSAAIHQRWLLWRYERSWRQFGYLMNCLVQGPVRRVAPALVLMGLIAFQEFELAALLQTASWTDWFITAQRVGLSQSEMLRQTVWPIVLQFPALLIVCRWIAQIDTTSLLSDRPGTQSLNRRQTAVVAGYLLTAFVLGVVVPLWVVAARLPGGLVLLVRQPVQSLGLGREILIAMAISVCAGTLTWFVSGAGTVRPGLSSWRAASVLLGLIPGLVGSLLISLAAVIVFQQPGLRFAYDTPLPWTVVLIVWLVPRAITLRLWFGTTLHSEAHFLAEQLIHAASGSRGSASARRLYWRLWIQPQWRAVGLLCYWGYLDLSSAYLLAPSAMGSGLVKLYNFMHFGRSAALSGEATLFFGVPLMIWFCSQQLAARWWIGSDQRK